MVGTNTYLIGHTNPYILVDAGEGKSEYDSLLQQALTTINKPTQPKEPDISDVIITHKHGDHILGLPSVLVTLQNLWNKRNPRRPYRPPKIHKIPLPTSDPVVGMIGSILREDVYTPASEGKPYHDLHDGQRIPLVSDDAYIKVLHTPGHTPDSLCLYLPLERALFTADSVLGHGTAVFEDLREYMNSLRKMIEFNDVQGGSGKGRGKGKGRYETVYPGHGNIIFNGPTHIAMYLQHRIEREVQIIELLKHPPVKIPTSVGQEVNNIQGEGALWTTWSIVGTIYKDYPENLWEPAARNVESHLKKLEDEGRAKRLGGEGNDAQWLLLQK